MSNGSARSTPAGEGQDVGTRAAAMGGGHGLSRCLRALTHVVDHTTAIVTTADDGGSSGRLRRQFGVVPPGDLRMALAALSPHDELVRLIQYRFESGELEGHSLGNLLIVATTDLRGGDIVAGLDCVAAFLAIPGRVLPCTPMAVQLRAKVEDREVAGQLAIARSPRVERVWLQPADPPASRAAVEAIRAAQLIVLGPGSLFTSVIPNLLVPEIAAAVAAASCPVVYVCNAREQRGETEGLDLPGHITALLEHAPDIHLSAIVAHDGPWPRPDSRALPADASELERFASQVVLADLLDDAGSHDPHKLTRALRQLL